MNIAAQILSLGLATMTLATIPVHATDGASGFKVTAQLKGPDGRWDLVSIDEAARRLYVAHADVVTAVNLDTHAVTPTLVKTAHAHGVVPLHGSTRVAVTNGDTNTITIFEGDSGKIVGEVKSGGKNPDALVHDPATGLLYVMNHSSGDISIVDPVSLKLVGSIDVGGDLELTTVDGKGRLYVNIENKNELAAVDLTSRKVVARVPLKGCVEPTGIAYEPKHDLVVSACDGLATVVSGRAAKQIASVAIGDGADTVMFDAAHNQFLIPNGADGTLTVIAEDANGSLKVVDTVTTAKNARTGALDPKTGRIYLPTAEFPPAPEDARPDPIPGSFKILVLER